MDERHARIALSLVSQVGGATLQRLLAHFGSASRVLKAGRRELVRVPGVGGAVAEALAAFRAEEALRDELARVEGAGVRLVVWGDAEYPPHLAHIASPPPVLYLKGSLTSGDAAAVAIVGARRGTSYGCGVASRLARELAARGVTIVSGMARGLDAAAHEGALAAGGRTLAVMGCGLARIYPSEHRKLADRIVGSGALLSEFPMAVEPLRGNFPRRNRIISGLALGVVVVEAGADSGALITAQHALDQGREVFAVPGHVTATYSQGCNRLIKAGAKLVEGWEDVLEEILPQLRGAPGPPARPVPTLPPLSEVEGRIFDLLAEGPLHIDLIIGRAGLGPGVTASALLSLEMKGGVRPLAGKVFARAEGL